MENRLTTLETGFDTVLPTLATKADIERLRAELQKWMGATIIGLLFGFGGLFVALKDAPPPVVPVQQAQPPVIITIPVPAGQK